MTTWQRSYYASRLIFELRSSAFVIIFSYDDNLFISPTAIGAEIALRGMWRLTRTPMLVESGRVECGLPPPFPPPSRSRFGLPGKMLIVLRRSRPLP